MDIRTKLVFALVAVALVSMFVLGLFAYRASSVLLQTQALRQLESVAEGKKNDLERVLVAWRDRARLVASRTQLRHTLASYTRTRDAADRARMERILHDARQSVRALRHASVHDPIGDVVASTGDPPPDLDLPDHATSRKAAVVGLLSVAFDRDERLVVTLHEPMRINGTPIGFVRVVLSADELVDIAQDTTGLGTTGETLIVRALPNGNTQILTPVREPDSLPPGRELGEDYRGSPSIEAARGVEMTFRGGVTDYRGRDVWAATRYLEEPDWGVVVKVDAAEEILAVTELRNTMVTLALSLSAFAIVAGAVLALYIAQPIRELAAVAHRISDGEHELRAPGEREDEIGELARAFNHMTEELIDANQQLEQRIRKQEGKDPHQPS